MPFDGRGQFRRLHDWTVDATAGIAIDPARWDEEEDDFAAGLSQCLTKDGQSVAYANIPMADVSGTGHVFTNVGLATASNQYARASQEQDGTFTWLGTATGSRNGLAFASPIPIAAYTTGMAVQFAASMTNTTAATINIAGLGAKSLKYIDYFNIGSGIVPIATGRLQPGNVYNAIYDGTDFQLTRKGTTGLAAANVNAVAFLASSTNYFPDTLTAKPVYLPKKFTFSAFVKLEGGTGTAITFFNNRSGRYNSGTAGYQVSYWIGRNASHKLQVNVGGYGQASSTTVDVVRSVFSTSSVVPGAGFNHVFISHNSSGTNVTRIYIDGVDAFSTGTGTAIGPFTTATAVGALTTQWKGIGGINGEFAALYPFIVTPGSSTASAKRQLIGFDAENFMGCIAEIWYDERYYDPVTSGITKFRNGDGTPANVGTNGQLPTGNTPLIYLRGTAKATNNGSIAYWSGSGPTAPCILADGTGSASACAAVPSNIPAITAYDYNGSTQYGDLGGTLTGISDGKACTFSGWIRVDANGSKYILVGGNTSAAQQRFAVNITAGNKIQVLGLNSAGTTILQKITTPTYVAGGGWVHILFSCDLATTTSYLYINDAAPALDTNTNTNDTIDFVTAVPNWRVGASAAVTASLHWNGCLSELFFHNTYIDLSVEANRRLFITAGLDPVELGSDGSIPLGVQPLLYMPKGLPSDNKGSGGSFTVSGGALEACSSSPWD